MKRKRLCSRDQTEKKEVLTEEEQEEQQRSCEEPHSGGWMTKTMKRRC